MLDGTSVPDDVGARAVHNDAISKSHVAEMMPTLLALTRAHSIAGAFHVIVCSSRFVDFQPIRLIACSWPLALPSSWSSAHGLWFKCPLSDASMRHLYCRLLLYADATTNNISSPCQASFAPGLLAWSGACAWFEADVVYRWWIGSLCLNIVYR